MRAAKAAEAAHFTHVLPLRVYWEDTDAGGIVYYANYLKFIERARSDMLRQAGVNQESLRHEGVVFAVRHCSIDYLLPARLDDDISVHSRLMDLKGASLRAEQVVRRGKAELARAEIRLACIDQSGRACRIPATVREALRPFATLSPNLSPISSSIANKENNHG